MVSNIPWKTKIPQKLWKMDFPQLLWKTGFHFILQKTELQLRTYGKLVSNSVIEDDVHVLDADPDVVRIRSQVSGGKLPLNFHFVSLVDFCDIQRSISTVQLLLPCGVL